MRSYPLSVKKIRKHYKEVVHAVYVQGSAWLIIVKMIIS